MNFLYKHLLAVEKKGVPYFTDIPRWQRVYLPILKRVYLRRYTLEVQVLSLQKKIALYEKDLVHFRRYLSAALRVDDIPFAAALELSGLIPQPSEPDSDDPCNFFADMPDAEYLAYWPDYCKVPLTSVGPR